MSPPDTSDDSQGSECPNESHIISLGMALAGMQVVGVPSNGSGFGTSAESASNYSASTPSSAATSSPFAITQESNWGDITEATQSAFPMSASQSDDKSFVEASSFDDALDANEAFDLFPSATNASKSRSSNVFRSASSTGAVGDALRPVHDSKRLTESPSCSVTATTTSSRSVSPYTNSSIDLSSARPNSAYLRCSDGTARNSSSFTDDDRSSSGYSSHPSLATLDSSHRSLSAKEWNANVGRNTNSSFIHNDSDRFYHEGMVAAPRMPVNDTSTSTAFTGSRQVLYMAIPSPDGRGEVLHPVQMVHVGGKTSYLTGGTQQQQNHRRYHNQISSCLPPLMHQHEHEFGRVTALDTLGRMTSYAADSSSILSSSPALITRALHSQQCFEDFDRSLAERSTIVEEGQHKLDSTISQLAVASHRPPLEALIGQIHSLSRDQVGCRLVQQALDEEGPMAASLIFTEGLQFWSESMVDPFGNYLFQKILEKISPDERIVLVKTVSSRLVNACLNLHGTRSVQKIVDICSMDVESRCTIDCVEEECAIDILVAVLSPFAARLCIDSHGNHVIQRILVKLRPTHTKFVFEAVAASVTDVARHRHGCCVIQRCLDSPLCMSASRHHLVCRIVEESLNLMQDAYGNYVVQYVLDVCSDEDVAAVCERVVGRVNLLAIQKFSSNVMEKCLDRCSDRVKDHYLSEISNPERIRELIMDPFGNYVVQRALAVATHAQAVRLVEVMKPFLSATQSHGIHGQRNSGARNTAGGRRIIAKICRRFPNFSFSPNASYDGIYCSNRASIHSHHQVAVHDPSYAPIELSGGVTQNHIQHIFTMDSFRNDQSMTHAHIPQTYYTLGGTPHYEHQYNKWDPQGFSGM